jgi:quercetin dioxygenase-like cupin family protein
VAIAEIERMKLVLVLTCFEAGQFILVHSLGADLALVVLEGSGAVAAGRVEHVVGPGAIVVIPAGEARGVNASSRLVAVHVVSPPPAESNRAPVQAGLRRGTWT